MSEPGKLLLVRLDNHRIGAGPATVIAHLASTKDMPRDRDGCVDPALRIWEGDGTEPIGYRVEMKRLVCGTGKGVFGPADEKDNE